MHRFNPTVKTAPRIALTTTTNGINWWKRNKNYGIHSGQYWAHAQIELNMTTIRCTSVLTQCLFHFLFCFHLWNSSTHRLLDSIRASGHYIQIMCQAKCIQYDWIDSIILAALLAIRWTLRNDRIVSSFVSFHWMLLPGAPFVYSNKCRIVFSFSFTEFIQFDSLQFHRYTAYGIFLAIVSAGTPCIGQIVWLIQRH